jgi:hypothetical protein
MTEFKTSYFLSRRTREMDTFYRTFADDSFHPRNQPARINARAVTFAFCYG